MAKLNTEEKNPIGETVEEEIQEGEEELLKLPFPNATVVREMKKYVASDKMIRKEVKIAMNKFLGEVVKELASKMNKFPYSTIDYRMFQDAARPYQQIKEIDKERQRLEAHLDAIIQDCYSVKRDLDAKFGEKNPAEVQL
jgi:hypothetical protein